MKKFFIMALLSLCVTPVYAGLYDDILGPNNGNSMPPPSPVDIDYGYNAVGDYVPTSFGNQRIQYGYNAPAKQCGRIRMVRISDIHENLVTWTTVPFCDIDELDISTYLLQPNDILFARTGGTVGKSFLVRDVPYEAIYAGYLIRTRYSALLCPQYLKYFMESPLYWQQLKTGTTATAPPNCNGQTLSNMLLPLPPAKEQYRIVEKINRAFAKVK